MGKVGGLEGHVKGSESKVRGQAAKSRGHRAKKKGLEEKEEEIILFDIFFHSNSKSGSQRAKHRPFHLFSVVE